jgi:hypothetical protein
MACAKLDGSPIFEHAADAQLCRDRAFDAQRGSVWLNCCGLAERRILEDQLTSPPCGHFIDGGESSVSAALPAITVARPDAAASIGDGLLGNVSGHEMGSIATQPSTRVTANSDPAGSSRRTTKEVPWR